MRVSQPELRRRLIAGLISQGREIQFPCPVMVVTDKHAIQWSDVVTKALNVRRRRP